MRKRLFASTIICLVVILQIAWLIQYYQLKVDIYCEDFEKELFEYNVEFFTKDIEYEKIKPGEENVHFFHQGLMPEQVKVLHSIERSFDSTMKFNIIYPDSTSNETYLDDTFQNYLIKGFERKFQKRWSEEVIFYLANEEYVKDVKNNEYFSSVMKIMYPLNINVQAKVQIPARKILLNMLPIIIIALIILVIFISTYYILNKLYVEQKIINQQKDIFINQMSHDFRLPLAVIKSVLNNIELKYDEDSDTKKITNICHNTINNLDEMVNSVLTMSGMNKKVEVNEILEGKDVINIIDKVKEEIFINKNVKIEIDSSKINNNKIVASSMLLRQIFVNMFNNAITYCEKDPIIKVSLISLDKGLEIYIEDNGIGIPDEDKEHIFEDFYRITKFSTVNGSGLGLYIAREFVNIMQGSLKLKSSSPQGSTFVVFIPNKIN
ncbi:HAMP domain-containing histidine kinase [Bacteroidales bacterium OttesenSCG-928-K03]|nr:HAMP domain-containing histidine kinase [Bacteroidales bacterium OttesenSCG-928-L14]MDL2240034.1 HAMP domain-containing histidine kinase [Bacteroidales bacterium OttesenSCG-928-K22]MDL2242254.1 HAMP domain-containing histidine kinase [Bacteroidales bacterium OttesenSCG-928-K03]